MSKKKPKRKEPPQSLDEALRLLDKVLTDEKALESKLNKIQPTLSEIKTACNQLSESLDRAQEFGLSDKVSQTLQTLQSSQEVLQLFVNLLMKREDLLRGVFKAGKQLQNAWLKLDKSLPDDWKWEKLPDKTLDLLIKEAEQFLTEPQKSELDKAYQSGDYSKVRAILYEFYIKWRKEGETMYTNLLASSASETSGNPPLFLILAILALAILAISFVCMKKSDKASAPNTKIKEIMSRNGAQEAATEEERTATEQEKDFLELIRLLAAASDKTDEYLKS